ncbi:MAG: hypothetical protein IKM39_03835, partial [Clostridia bacterium]|nr:hypothetical protein [Clostridia bacterium]
MTCVAAEQTYRYGDVNFDNSIDAKDALTTLKYAVYIEELTSVQCILGDVNKDTTVDAKDALDILKFAVDQIDSFEAGEFYTVVSTGEVTTANSVNGAYEQDATADCSFVMDNTGLESNTIYVVTKSCTTGMNVDQQRLLYSLQGLINRDFGMDDEHTSILYVSSDQADVKWLQYMQEDGSVYTEMKKKHVNSWDEFFEFFEHQIAYCGIIVWDGNVPSTSNVAATICGLDGYLPVLNQSPLHTWLLDRGIQQKQSLANIFKDNHKGETSPGSTAIGTGSAKNDAYLWALEKYFDRCSANYLAYILDGACTVYGYDAYPNNPVALLKDRPSNCLSNHDYLIAR